MLVGVERLLTIEVLTEGFCAARVFAKDRVLRPASWTANRYRVLSARQFEGPISASQSIVLIDVAKSSKLFYETQQNIRRSNEDEESRQNDHQKHDGRAGMSESLGSCPPRAVWRLGDTAWNSGRENPSPQIWAEHRDPQGSFSSLARVVRR